MPSRPAPAEPHRDAAPKFQPVPVRYRHDGWSAERQIDFIDALAETGCVAEASARVGMSTASAYALRRRIEAESFRAAWEAALDYAVQRLTDALFSRAIHGVPVPVFYRGEQIGERRQFNDGLAMFLLRHRDQRGYGKWRERHLHNYPSENLAVRLYKRLCTVVGLAPAEQGDREDVGKVLRTKGNGERWPDLSQTSQTSAS